MNGDRLRSARLLLSEKRLEWLLVSDPYDVRYLSGFRGEDACLLVGADEALICTDSRFWPQVAEEVSEFALEKTEALYPDAVAALARRGGARSSMGFAGSHLTFSEYRAIRRLHKGPLRDVKAALGALRAVKSSAEIAIMRRAAAITDRALETVVGEGLGGRQESEVAWRLASAFREEGAEDVAFAAIVAAGEHGAQAHAIPGERRLESGDLVVIDIGARCEGYCSDITRTFAVGRVGDEQRRVYEVVLAAQLAGLAAVRAGVDGRAVDAAARRVIEEAGYGEYFGHGTGHGVGLEVHELPRLGRTHGDLLRAGMVATVEPGIYLEGKFGIRIEDTVVVTPDGCERLTLSAKELRIVD